MLHLIFPNQLTYTQTKELRSKELFIVSGFKEVNNAVRDMKTSILKDGLNTSANLFHFCEVKDIFKFIHWETWVRRVTLPDDDALIFDIAGFNYIPKQCYTRGGCDDCAYYLKKDCNPHSGYIYHKELGGYLAPQVFLERRKFIWEPKTIKYLMALGADPNLINHRAVEDLIKYGNFESFKLFYDKTNGFETSGLSHENIWWVPVGSRLEKLFLLALMSTRYDKRNYLRFLIEQGLDIHALDDKLLKEAFRSRVINNSITCFKYLYNLEPTYFNNLEWFTKEVDFWFKKPEDQEAFFESLKFKERVRVVKLWKATWHSNSNIPELEIPQDVSTRILSEVEKKEIIEEVIQEEIERNKLALQPLMEPKVPQYPVGEDGEVDPGMSIFGGGRIQAEIMNGKCLEEQPEFTWARPPKCIIKSCLNCKHNGGSGLCQPPSPCGEYYAAWEP